MTSIRGCTASRRRTKTQFVTEASGVLPVLERISDLRPKEDFAIDRHLAAFLAARFPDGGHDWFEPLGSADPAQVAESARHALSPGAPPGEIRAACRAGAGAAHRAAIPGIDRPLPQPHPAQPIEGRAAEAGGARQSRQILSFLDNAAERQRDSACFQAALREHAMIERQLQALRLQAPRRLQQAEALGARVAATSSGILAWLVGLAAVVLLGGCCSSTSSSYCSSSSATPSSVNAVGSRQ